MYYLGEDKLIEIFCKVDDLTKEIGELFKQRSLSFKLPYRQPTRTCQLQASEINDPIDLLSFIGLQVLQVLLSTFSPSWSLADLFSRCTEL